VTAPPTLAWREKGEGVFAAALGLLSDQDLDRPSLLPGWSRRTVAAHVARNADALINLLTWARTGHETPMYATPQARDSAIADTAALPAAEIRADCRAAAQRFTVALRELPAAAWSTEVRTAQGRIVPAAKVPWMRCREVWVHAADLDAAIGFRDIPDDVLAALVDDVTGTWHRRSQNPALALATPGRTWGSGAVTVTGTLPDIAAWITGRGDADRVSADGFLPSIPPWL